jgi:hypothetical protein
MEKVGGDGVEAQEPVSCVPDGQSDHVRAEPNWRAEYESICVQLDKAEKRLTIQENAAAETTLELAKSRAREHRWHNLLVEYVRLSRGAD